jgi:hypothetical protein
MSRKSPQHISFRPRLETLEGRELPSSLGVSLFLLNNQTMAALNTQTNLVSNLQSTSTTLTNDINGGASSTTINNDYSKAGSLFGQIKSLNTEITALVNLEQLISFVAVNGDSTDQQVAFFVFFGLGSITSKNNANFSTATDTINTAQPGGFPTIGAGANV